VRGDSSPFNGGVSLRRSEANPRRTEKDQNARGRQKNTNSEGKLEGGPNEPKSNWGYWVLGPEKDKATLQGHHRKIPRGSQKHCGQYKWEPRRRGRKSKKRFSLPAKTGETSGQWSDMIGENKAAAGKGKTRKENNKGCPRR